MATSAFKSTSRRGGSINSSTTPNPNSNSNSNSNSSQSKSPSLVRRRSLSVSAIARASPSPQQLDIASEFSNKCDNPLFWTSKSPTENHNGSEKAKEIVKDKVDFTRKGSVSGGGSSRDVLEQEARGRTVTRGSSGVKNGIGRSVSRVRGRSVSRGHYGSAYESERELQSNTIQGLSSKNVVNSSKNSKLVRNDADRSSQAKSLQRKVRHSQGSEYSEDDSVCSVHMSSWEDGISTGSLSEVEEKTIKAVCEQKKSVGSDLWCTDTATSDIYETVRSEVRRAISDIQTDLESAIQRNNVNAIATASVADIPPDLVNPGTTELVLDIKREYAKKLDESEERARKLRSDLAVEEHRGLEISRILKEILPDSKPSPSQRSRAGRKRSNERKKMTKRLTEEALAYFDECVSISTFDSSDFSAPEDPSNNSLGATITTGVTASVPLGSPNTMSSSSPLSYSNYKQVVHDHVQHIASHEDSCLTANSCNEQVKQRGLQFQFSFAHNSPETSPTQDGLRSYIKHFEREANKDVFNSNSTKSFYDADEYKLKGHRESLLFDRVFFRNRLDSGGLHLCDGGYAVACFPFGSA